MRFLLGILANTYTVYLFVFIILFTTAGELNNYLNKFSVVTVALLFVIVSSYSMAMLKREVKGLPTARFYNSGIPFLVHTVLTVLIYIGGVYVLIKSY